jgi:hypothetical protein
MQDFGPLVASVLGVFLVMGIGALCRRVRWLTEEADRTLASLTANVMLPAYFVHKFTQGESFRAVGTVWQPPLLGFATTVIGFAIALAFARSVGRWFGLTSDASQRAFALCVGICNYGYIPLPLAERFYESAVLDLILHNVGVDVALWSVGIAIISGTGGGDGWKRPLRSGPLWAVLFSIALHAFGLVGKIPSPIITALGALGGCAIPLGLLLSGAILMDFVREGTWWQDRKVIVAAIGLRQLVLPVLMLGIGGAVVRQSDLRTVLMLQAAMPAAVFPIVLTKLYDRDTGTALRVVLWTSIAGLMLIPTWLAVGGWWLNSAR